jgi:hypothetical protein
MKTLLVMFALVGTAHGDARALVKPPPGWTADTAQADALRIKANDLSHFGGATHSFATTEVYMAPKPGVALFVTAVAAKVSVERDAATRVAVDELHATSQRAALAGSGIREEAWQERVDAAAKQVEATLTWRDTGAGTLTHARMIIAGDPENLVSITGECLVGDGADASLIDACKAALATLDPGLDAAKRVAIGLSPPGSRPAAPGSEPARMSDGTHTPLPPMTVRQEDHSIDRRPVYVGAGIVVLAGLFWWNRRRRARFEKESNE